jgi:hypothetical protein
MDELFFGLTKVDLGKLAYDFAKENNLENRFNEEKKSASRMWIESFCKRHNLTLRTPEKCSIARAMGFNRVQVDRFYKNLETCLKEKHFPPHRIFNVDESGISTVPNKDVKTISPRGKKNVSRVVSADRGITVTIVCCMSATGQYVPPGMIFPRLRKKNELYEKAPTGTLPMVSESGFITSELFLDWMKHFQSHVHSSADSPVLLILDNHTSHRSLDVILFCREHHITLLSLPPHASHKMQPLDRVFFFSLKDKYSREVSKWLVSNPGRVVTQYQIAELFREAYVNTATVGKGEEGFRCTGICPFNNEIFSEEDFAPSLVTDRE